MSFCGDQGSSLIANHLPAMGAINNPGPSLRRKEWRYAVVPHDPLPATFLSKPASPSSCTRSSGNAGNIEWEGNNLLLTKGSQFLAAAEESATGKVGSIAINATGSIVIGGKAAQGMGADFSLIPSVLVKVEILQQPHGLHPSATR
jgi:hypothetical protein